MGPLPAVVRASKRAIAPRGGVFLEHAMRLKRMLITAPAIRAPVIVVHVRVVSVSQVQAILV